MSTPHWHARTRLPTHGAARLSRLATPGISTAIPGTGPGRKGTNCCRSFAGSYKKAALMTSAAFLFTTRTYFASSSSFRRFTNAAGSSSWPPSASNAWSNRMCAQSSKLRRPRFEPLHQRMVRVDLQDRLATPAPSGRPASACARRLPRHVVLVGHQAGRRIGQARASRARPWRLSPSAAFMRSTRSLNAVAASSCCLLLGLVCQLAEIERALGDRLQLLAFEFVQDATASIRRRGRSAAAPRCPSCGRSPAAGCSSPRRSVSAVT